MSLGEEDRTGSWSLSGAVHHVLDLGFSGRRVSTLPASSTVSATTTLRGEQVLTNFDLVRQFHHMFGLPIRNRPQIPPEKEGLLRLDLIVEEAGELAVALRLGDIVGVADALGDLLYVCYGACLVCGLDADAVMAEIHRSNMSKLHADGKPIYRADGKVLKGDLYVPPDLEKVLGVTSA